MKKVFSFMYDVATLLVMTGGVLAIIFTGINYRIEPKKK